MHMRTHQPRNHNPARQIRDLLVRVPRPQAIRLPHIGDEIPVHEDAAVEDYLAGWVHGHECGVRVQHCSAGLLVLGAGLGGGVGGRKFMRGMERSFS